MTIETNTTTDTTTATKTAVKQPTPCERATAAAARAKAAYAEIKSLVVGQTGIVADIAAEAQTLATAAKQSAKSACLESLSFVRRQAASVRTKAAAEGLETIARDIAALISESQAESDDALIAELENCPGYTKNPEWLAAQERRESRLHA